jgi:hypothetical protein
MEKVVQSGHDLTVILFQHLPAGTQEVIPAATSSDSGKSQTPHSLRIPILLARILTQDLQNIKQKSHSSIIHQQEIIML